MPCADAEDSGEGAFEVGLTPTAGPLPQSLDRLNQTATVLNDLPARFDNLQRVLLGMGRHVKKPDEKTGPNPQG